MGTKLISLNRLNREHLSDLGTLGFRTVLARDDLGDVMIWRSHQESDVDHEDTSAGEFIDLIVLGEPKAVATKMVTELAFGRGVYEKPILMTLAHGLNWTHHWYAEKCPEKAHMLNRLNGIVERSFQHLEHDRLNFSSLLINDLLSAIDQSIKKRNWLDFEANVERLYEQDALKSDPHGIPPDWWAPQHEQ
jgi:hypothetical protein